MLILLRAPLFAHSPSNDTNGNLTSVPAGTVYSPDGSSSMSFSRKLSHTSFNPPNVIGDTQYGWW